MHRNDLPIATPCHEDWSSMTREGRRRFCDVCKKHVHDLSSMSRDEAKALLASATTERLCVRYIHDAQGYLRFAGHERRAWLREISEDFVLPPQHLVRARRAVWAMAAAAMPLSLAACMGGATPPPTVPPTLETPAGHPGKARPYVIPAGAKMNPVLPATEVSNVNPVEPPQEELMGDIPAYPFPPAPAPPPGPIPPRRP